MGATLTLLGTRMHGDASGQVMARGRLEWSFAKSFVPFVRAIEVRHRRVFVRASNLIKAGDGQVGAAISAVFLHGCHHDLEGTLSDATLLLRGLKRCDKSFMIGDSNVDILSLRSDDPYKHTPGRSTHHAYRTLL